MLYDGEFSREMEENMDIITEMESYARAHDVPIMEKEGIAFMLDVIQTHGCRRILEIGTAIGYSAIRMALVHEDIHVVSIERDEQRWQEACRNVEKAGLSSRITLILGDALETEIDGEFDFLFIDAAKAQYTRFFERYTPLLKQGGIVLSDNLGFHGMVEGKTVPKSRGTRNLVRKIRGYIDYLEHNAAFETEFYDVGDRVAVSKKR